MHKTLMSSFTKKKKNKKTKLTYVFSWFFVCSHIKFRMTKVGIIIKTDKGSNLIIF